MSLDRGYTYGRRASKSRGPAKPLWRRPWFIAVVVVLAGLIVAVNLVAPTTADQPAPPPAATSAPAPTPTPSVKSVGAPRAAWTAANTFLNGWSSTDKATRAKVFEQTALGDLAAGLADTSPENIVTEPVAQIDVISDAAYSVEFRVWITGQADPVWLLLTSGHSTSTNPYDWRVAEIERRPV